MPPSRPIKSNHTRRYMKDVMFDAETLGTKADAVIMSIGAVKFDLASGEIADDAFYASVSIDSNLQLGRKVDESTLIWWLGQSSDAQRVFHEPKTPLEIALADLVEWLGHNKRNVWSNGADFDIPMFAHAYSQIGVEPPWLFYNTRCLRTYRSLPCAVNVPKPEPQIKHHAMYDALAQAQHAQAIYAAMVAKKVPA